MKVIIDTNSFMIPVLFGVDIFRELERLGYKEFIAPFSVVRELKGLKKFSKGKNKLAANAGLTLSERCIQETTQGPADDAIIELAIAKDAAVLTTDVELKERLSNKSITVIHLRGKTHLEIMEA